MRYAAIIVAAAISLATTASAQSTWQEYRYADQQFAVSFPAEPTVTTMASIVGNGIQATETIYSIQQDTGLFRVSVTGLTSSGINRMNAIDQAVAGLRAKGDIKLDIRARVQRNVGRYLNIAGNDGSHTIAAVFFGAGHLSELEGTVPASNPDALSGEMIRFQQGLRFMGDAVRGKVSHD